MKSILSVVLTRERVREHGSGRWGGEEFDDEQAPDLTNRTRRHIREVGIGTAVRVARSRRLADGEQSAAQLQLVLTDSIGEETELADADQSAGQHVQQKAADELDRVQSHGLGTAAVRVVLPIKRDTPLLQRSQ